jgi:hypothetical protein
MLGGLSLDSRNFVEGFLEFRGFTPKVSPISVSDSGRESGTDRVEHIFGWVDVVWTHCAATSKILADDGWVGSDVAKVDLFEAKMISLRF